jgi:hypothetical protein
MVQRSINVTGEWQRRLPGKSNTALHASHSVAVDIASKAIGQATMYVFTQIFVTYVSSTGLPYIQESSSLYLSFCFV